MRCLIACLLVLLMTPAVRAGTAERLPEDLRFTLIDGRSLASTALRGRPLLIVFWASTCATCVAELPDLAALYRDMHPRGLELVALAMPYDPTERVAAARKVLRLPFPVAIDVNATVVRALGVPQQTPQFLLVDADGRIVAVHDGAWPVEQLKAALLPLLPHA